MKADRVTRCRRYGLSVVVIITYIVIAIVIFHDSVGIKNSSGPFFEILVFLKS